MASQSKSKKHKLSQIGKVSLTMRTTDTHVAGADLLITPRQVKAKLPAKKKHYQTVLAGRQAVQDILDRQDDRLFVVVGPCSIHDPKAAWEYAVRLKKVASLVKSTLLVVMRVYFEKPRTTTGWKGLVNDPHMDDSFRIEEGILLGRKLLLKFNELGLPCATESLDPIIPQYMADLIAWSAIGARTTESQTHRELASGLSMPVGLKNATDGGVQIAINGIKSARAQHHFLGMNQDGMTAVIHTTGNPYAHIVLRGGMKPNYDAASIHACEQALMKENLPVNIVVDCSHGNSNKDYRLQPTAFKDVIRQVAKGNKSIVGLMLESNLREGSQPIPEDLSQLKYGVSVTDACINWDKTEELLLEAHKTLSKAKR
jgi:3-deoxy-7-phosphoheptulonate synthase